jgi:hypothetical protein
MHSTASAGACRRCVPARQEAAAVISRLLDCVLAYAATLLDSDISDRKIRADCAECTSIE